MINLEDISDSVRLINKIESYNFADFMENVVLRFPTKLMATSHEDDSGNCYLACRILDYNSKSGILFVFQDHTNMNHCDSTDLFFTGIYAIPNLQEMINESLWEESRIRVLVATKYSTSTAEQVVHLIYELISIRMKLSVPFLKANSVEDRQLSHILHYGIAALLPIEKAMIIHNIMKLLYTGNAARSTTLETKSGLHMHYMGWDSGMTRDFLDTRQRSIYGSGCTIEWIDSLI